MAELPERKRRRAAYAGARGSPAPSYAPLTSVLVVARGHQKVAACADVVRLLSRFLDHSAGWRVDEAAARGLIHLLHHVHSQDYGHLSVVKHLHEQYASVPATPELLVTAAVDDHLGIVWWLVAHKRVDCPKRVMDQAAANGHLDVLKMHHRGDLRMVKWLSANQSEGCTADTMGRAASSGRLVMLGWLHANRDEDCFTSAMDLAAAHGHLGVVKWLYAHRIDSHSREALGLAALNSQSAVVRWLHSNTSEWLQLLN